MTLKETYFSLGTNLGDRERNISVALDMLSAAFGAAPVAVSRLIETEPGGFESENRFLNCAARFDLSLAPPDILKVCKDVESEMGRPIHEPEYAIDGRRLYRSRIIDIDILLCGSESFSSERLQIPHPQMHLRDFVMIPLSEIVSDEAKRAFPSLFE